MDSNSARALLATYSEDKDEIESFLVNIEKFELSVYDNIKLLTSRPEYIDNLNTINRICDYLYEPLKKHGLSTQDNLEFLIKNVSTGKDISLLHRALSKLATILKENYQSDYNLFTQNNFELLVQHPRHASNIVIILATLHVINLDIDENKAIIMRHLDHLSAISVGLDELRRMNDIPSQEIFDFLMANAANADKWGKLLSFSPLLMIEDNRTLLSRYPELIDQESVLKMILHDLGRHLLFNSANLDALKLRIDQLELIKNSLERLSAVPSLMTQANFDMLINQVTPVHEAIEFLSQTNPSLFSQSNLNLFLQHGPKIKEWLLCFKHKEILTQENYDKLIDYQSCLDKDLLRRFESLPTQSHFEQIISEINLQIEVETAAITEFFLLRPEVDVKYVADIADRYLERPESLSSSKRILNAFKKFGAIPTENKPEPLPSTSSSASTSFHETNLEEPDSLRKNENQEDIKQTPRKL